MESFLGFIGTMLAVAGGTVLAGLARLASNNALRAYRARKRR